MSTIVEASIPAGQFALRETMARIPDVSFETVRIVTGGSGGAVPLLWCFGDDPQTITSALDADESTTEVREIARQNETVLYYLKWTTQVHVVTDLLVAGRGAILGAQAREGTWTFRVLYPERAAVAAAVELCDCGGVDLDVERITPMTEPTPVRRSDLTDQQFRTVQSALEHGYYEIPRETTLTELAAELGVSHQAVSERLRRGHRQLVEAALAGPVHLESRP